MAYNIEGLLREEGFLKCREKNIFFRKIGEEYFCVEPITMLKERLKVWVWIQEGISPCYEKRNNNKVVITLEINDEIYDDATVLVFRIPSNLEGLIEKARSIGLEVKTEKPNKGGLGMVGLKLGTMKFGKSDILDFKPIGITFDGKIAIPSKDGNYYTYAGEGTFSQSVFYLEGKAPFSKIAKIPKKGSIICVDGEYGIFENDRIVFPDGKLIEVKEPQMLIGSRYEVLMDDFIPNPFMLILFSQMVEGGEMAENNLLLLMMLMGMGTQGQNQGFQNFLPFLLLMGDGMKDNNLLLAMMFMMMNPQGNNSNNLNMMLPLLLLSQEREGNSILPLVLIMMMNNNNNNNNNGNNDNNA